MTNIHRKFTTITNLVSPGKLLIFYVLACVISWFFILNRNFVSQILADYDIPEKFGFLGVMWGPGIAALFCFWIFRRTHFRKITFRGTSLKKGLVFYFLPYVVFIILMVVNPVPEMKLSNLIFLIPFGFLMILGEELGWRGYLQDVLRQVPEWKKWR